VIPSPPAIIAQAANLPDVPAELQALMRQRIGRVRGSVVVIARRFGDRGRVDVMTGGDAPKVDASSRFELGGASEGVTALLLADAVRRGEVRLDEAIDERPTTGLRAPVRDGKRITFADLATHRSGLPRVPLRESVQPYRGSNRDSLFALVSSARLAAVPGTAFAPANTEYALLGTLLADRSGTTFAQLAKQRVFVPLDMPNTAADDLQDDRLVPERSIDSRPVAAWRWDAFAPEGGVRSTAADLLRLTGAFFDGDNGPLAQDARLAATPRASAGDQGIGLGWMVDGPSGGLWVSGWSYGATSFIGIAPHRQAAVVLLSNTGLAFGNASLDDIGLRMLTATAAAR
jgi:serine-type D-Ala-D-Ala carboxypeptidase/endopeptidase